MSLPTAGPGAREPSGAKKGLAYLVVLVAIALLVFGLVGLLAATSVAGLLFAGVVLVGLGVALTRLSWRLYRGAPSRLQLPRADAGPEEARAAARALIGQQGGQLARFLLVLTPVYLLIALLFADGEAAVGAAAVSAIAAGLVGLTSWQLTRAARHGG